VATRRKLWWGVAIAAGLLLLVALAAEGELAILIANQRPDAEAARLAKELRLDGDEPIAEIGAGAGNLTVSIARLVPRGRVYSTELDPDRLEDIRDAVREAGVTNVEVREAALEDTNLPASCCDAIFMRTVYHHFTTPPVMLAALHRSLKPGGRLAIIEFPPPWFLSLFFPTSDVPERGGHGVPIDFLLREVTAGGGFRHELTIERWVGRLYLMVFERV
jgi:ubiquinone/menaquinone biosynthesis C-methylase UbiE